MAKVLGGSQTVPLEEVVLAQAFQWDAPLTLLEWKGVTRTDEALAAIMRQR